MSTRRLFLPLAAAFVVVACTDAPVVTDPISPSNAALAASDAGIIPGRFIVTLRDGAAPAAVARAHGVKADYVYSHVLNGFAGSISDAARSGLLRDARVVRVEPDGIARISATQSPATWGLDRIDQRDLPLNNSYTYNAAGAGVTAYIIDTGIRGAHDDFGGRVTGGVNFVEVCTTTGTGRNRQTVCETDPAAWQDCNGHGTHVAGTVGGTTYGVAKAASLFAVRVLNCSGSGTWSAVVAGMDWVAANREGPAVVNMSLGGGLSSSVNQAVARLTDAGVTTVVAAGNSNANACNYSPAGAPSAITVGATTSADVRASYSNYGSCVDWFAPGSSISSAWHTSNTATNTISGTSMASPHVAGGAALYLQANPGSTPSQVRDGLFALTTKSIVSSSNSTNNHLLYTADIAAGGSPPAPIVTTISANSPTDQQAPAGSTVTPPSVVVRDQFNNPMSGVTVNFAVTAGSGSVSTVADTDGAGVATAANWTLDSSPGANGVRASVSGSLFVDFSATGTPAGGEEEPPSVPLQASFTYSCSAFTCEFTSTSTGSVTTSEWTSPGKPTQQGATAVFSSAAKQNFTVTLTVGDGTGTSSASRAIRCNPNFCQ